MGKESIKVIIDENKGTVSFDCNGFTGDGCDIINKLEAAVSQGGSIKRNDKDERYHYVIPEGVQNFI